MIGQTFGRLTVIKHGQTKGNRLGWWCICICGNKVEVRGANLRNSHTQSCGRCVRRTHGLRQTSEYGIWDSMKRRCASPKDSRYESYGGRGIQVCERWRLGDGKVSAFECFILDIGRRPSMMHQIDRIDNDGNYEPTNCRWATLIKQANNRRSTKIINYRGSNMTLSQAIRSYGSVVKYATAHRRIANGWPVSLAVETAPLRHF